MAMKKLNYTLTVYKNTGFNSIDRPLTPSVLENASKNTYNVSYYLREDIDNPIITVDDNYYNLVDVDYVKLVSNDVTQPNTFYYAVTNVTAMSGNSVSLSLDLDALLTMGGVSNLTVSGYQVRGHIAKADDVLFGNNLPEDFVPSNPLENSDYIDVESVATSIFDGGSGPVNPSEDFQLVATNIDLFNLGRDDPNHANEIEVLAGMYSGSEVMYVPKINALEADSATEFGLSGYQIAGQGGQHMSLKIPSFAVFDYTYEDVIHNEPVIKRGVEKLHSCGQLQLIASYTLPKEWILMQGTTRTASGRYSVLNGDAKRATLSQLPFEDNTKYVVKNKKVFSMFRNYTLVNPASGSMIIKDVKDLKYTYAPVGGSNAPSTAPELLLWADVTSIGKPMGRFLTDLNSPYADTVYGSCWINSGILLEGASGSLLNNVNNAFNQQTIQRQISQIKMNDGIADENYRNNSNMLTNGRIMRGAMQLIGATTPNIDGSYNAGGILKGAAQFATEQVMADMAQHTLDIQRMQTYRQNQHSLEDLRLGREANDIKTLIANECVAPTSLYMPEPSLAMYGLNKFICFETWMSAQDLQELDYYFQRFGYNMHKKLDSTSFDKRDYYTYVQAYDINIKSSGSYGLRVRQKGIAQLASGQRFWKVLPDPSYYESN